MRTEILVPALGESVSEATVAKWLRARGDLLAVDEPVVELETDKATLEIGAPKAGVLIEIAVEAGQDVEVGSVLGFIDESAVAEAGEASAEATPEAPPVPRAEPPSPQATAPVERPRAPADPPADPSGLDPSEVPRRGPGGKVTAEDLLRFAAVDPGPSATAQQGPAARKLLADHGIAPSDLQGSGRDGRITKGDVLAHLASARGVEQPGGPSEERVRMSRLRRTIAARLKSAQETAAILTTFNEIDMSAIRALRARYREAFEEKHGVRLGFMSFFAKATVVALRDFPVVNAEVDGDEIVYKHRFDLGMAVSTAEGLVVPVVRDCDRRSLAEIESTLAELAARAQDGKLAVDEMSGGTFTISNGGVFGSLLSTPILNPPQSGILGLHKFEDRPVAVDGRVEIRPMMYVALSYDHRIVDGREAVGFLVRVKEMIEDPERLLLDV